MTAKLTIDSAGRVVLPKGVRDELQLRPGDQLELDTEGERISLRPVRATTPLRKEHGIWVYRTGHPLPVSAVDDTIRRIREERNRRNLGSVA